MLSCEFLRNPHLIKSGRNCDFKLLKSSRHPITLVVASYSKQRNNRGRRESSQRFSMESPPKGYRRNVGICLVNTSKMIFTASRINIPDTWQMPQGGADDGEDLRNAAMRELREETGVTSAEFLAEVPYWLTYDFPLKIRDRLNRRWGTKYRGQAQKWFLFKFTGDEEEINLLGDGSEKPEFNNWSWMLPERVVELAVDFKRPVYKQVMNFFGPYLQADPDEILFSTQISCGSKLKIKESVAL